MGEEEAAVDTAMGEEEAEGLAAEGDLEAAMEVVVEGRAMGRHHRATLLPLQATLPLLQATLLLLLLMEPHHPPTEPPRVDTMLPPKGTVLPPVGMTPHQVGTVEVEAEGAAGTVEAGEEATGSRATVTREAGLTSR